MLNGFLRTTLFCSSAERSLALYRDILGFAVVEDKTISGPAAGALLNLGECRLRMIMLAPSPKAAPVIGLFEISDAAIPSLAFQARCIAHGQAAIVISTDDFAALYRRLMDHGVIFLTPPADYVKRQSSAHAPAGIYREMIFRDPDGVLVSVIEIRPLAETEKTG